MVLFPEGKPVKKETFEEYRASGGYSATASHRTPAGILDEITASGLKGRGGAGFPVGRKWKVAAETAVTPRHIVCNAGEDEPGSFKDRTLIECRPHLILEGAILAARAIDAEEAYFYIIDTYDDSIARIQTAIDESTTAGVMDSIKISIQRSPTSLG